MERESISRKKAILALSMMVIGANARKIANYEEPNCNVYDAEGACSKCSYRFWMTEEGRCRQVSDQCRTFKEDCGDCTSCYLGYSLSGRDCVLGNAVETVQIVQSEDESDSDSADSESKSRNS